MKYLIKIDVRLGWLDFDIYLLGMSEVQSQRKVVATDIAPVCMLIVSFSFSDEAAGQNQSNISFYC